MLLFRAQEIQEETANETRVDHVTVAKNLYMEGVTNVKRAKIACVGIVCFGARSAAIRGGSVTKFARHVKKLTIIYKGRQSVERQLVP